MHVLLVIVSRGGEKRRDSPTGHPGKRRRESGREALHLFQISQESVLQTHSRLPPNNQAEHHNNITDRGLGYV